MESFLIFLAIIAIQIIAAYSKQKKEAAKRKQQQQAPRSVSEYEKPIPAPDPFREIREALDLPPVEEEPEEFEKIEKIEKFKKHEEPVLEGARPPQPKVPFRLITDRTQREKIEPEREDLSQVRKLKIHQAIDINNPGQGILWTAILQEPRYKVKWKRR